MRIEEEEEEKVGKEITASTDKPTNKCVPIYHFRFHDSQSLHYLFGFPFIFFYFFCYSYSVLRDFDRTIRFVFFFLLKNEIFAMQNVYKIIDLLHKRIEIF